MASSPRPSALTRGLSTRSMSYKGPMPTHTTAATKKSNDDVATEDDSDHTTIHLSTPGPDTGSFTTLQVRPRTRPVDLTSRTIAFPRGNYSAPPNVAGGFTMLDLAAAAPGVRANLVGSDLTKDAFRIGLETWGGGVMYAAGASWIEHKAGARECHFGQVDTMDAEVGVGRRGIPMGLAKWNGSANAVAQVSQQSYSRTIKFPKVLDGTPEIVCWLNRVDFETGKGRTFRVRGHYTQISERRATMALTTWGESCVLNGAAMCWIAFPKGKSHVDSGQISTKGKGKRQTTGRTAFAKGCFTKPPTVLVALDMLDMVGDRDLKVKVEVERVTKEGFSWRIETWDDSILHEASASWVALGFV